MSTITAVEMREAIRKSAELKALFAQAVTIEMLEQQIVERAGTFRAMPPGIDRFTNDIYETVITELIQETDLENISSQNAKDLLHKVGIFEQTLAAACVLGWMADEYEKEGKGQAFDEFAFDYLPRYH